MFNKKLTTLIAASVMMAATPAIGQGAAVQPQTEAVSGSAQFSEAGTEVYILGAIVGALAIWGFIELIDDGGDDLEISPN